MNWCGIPASRGLYVYLQEAYGRPVAFLYGWGLLTLIHSGTIATQAVAFGIYVSQIANLTNVQEKLAECSLHRYLEHLITGLRRPSLYRTYSVSRRSAVWPF